MPFTIRIDPEYHFAEVTLAGAVSLDEIVEASMSLREQPNLAALDRQVWDARDVDSVVGDPEDDAILQYAALLCEHGMPMRGKRAFVVREGFVQETAALYADLLEQLGLVIELFHDIDEAREWVIAGTQD